MPPVGVHPTSVLILGLGVNPADSRLPGAGRLGAHHPATARRDPRGHAEAVDAGCIRLPGPIRGRTADGIHHGTGRPGGLFSLGRTERG